MKFIHFIEGKHPRVDNMKVSLWEIVLGGSGYKTGLSAGRKA
jgi:hypothetical protein